MPVPVPVPVPDLPVAVHVQTSTRATTVKDEYAVIDGRIYTKKKGAPKQAWTLIDDDGRPDRQGLPSDFSPIVSISADDNGLSTVTQSGHIVRWSPGAWDGLWGLPVPTVGERLPLPVPPNAKALAHSVRRGDVAYYEDTLGNQFNWGFAGTTSLYALAEDGRRILLGDPWLAPDVSRQVCGPNRGTFRAVNLAASASTVFVIGDNGEMYTTFFDYDSGGGTPMINYAYFDRAPLHGLSGMDRNSEYEVRALPAEGWTKEPAISGGRITKNIAILQNGKGNAARELRVQGVNDAGESGYFTKPLRAKAWSFVVTGEEIGEPLDVHTPLEEHTPLEFVFKGASFRGDDREREIVAIEVPDFHFHCSPFHIAVHVSGGGRIDLAMHTVDAWSPFAQSDAEMDPSAYKALKGTIEIVRIERPKGGGSTTFADVLARFQKHHLESFRYGIVASQRTLEIFVLDPVFGAEPWGAEMKLGRGGRGQAPAPEVALEGRAQIRRDVILAQRARQRAAKEANDARRAVRIALQSKMTAAGLNWLTTLTTTRFTRPDTAWITALDQHMPAIAETMVRVQRNEAKDARRVRDAAFDRLAKSYCAAVQRVEPTANENPLYDYDLSRRCRRR